MRKGVFVAAIVFVFLTSVGVSFATPWETEPKFELEGIWWFSNLKGTISAGSEIDAKGDLGLKSTDFAEGRLTWYINDDHRIRLGVANVSNDGSATVQKQFVFNGTTYPVGANINTTIDFTYSRLGWTWEFINIDKNTFKFGAMLDIDWLMLEPKINGTLSAGSSTSHFDASKKFNLVLPTIGLAADYNPVKYVNIFADAEGIAAGKYGYVFDFEAGIKVIPVKWFSIVGAYRYLELKAKDNGASAKVTYNGPYVGVTFRY
jgi:hypothetical protein